MNNGLKVLRKDTQVTWSPEKENRLRRLLKAIWKKVRKFGLASTFGKGRCTGREEQQLDVEKGCDGGHFPLLASGEAKLGR